MMTMRVAMNTASAMLCVTRKMLLRPACPEPRQRSTTSRAQVLRGQHVERAERLVHAQHFGLRDQRAREADALAHAARQLLRIRILVAGQADQFERALDFLLRPARAEAALDEPDLHVLLHGEPRIERKALEHDRRAAIDAVERRAVAAAPRPASARSDRPSGAGSSTCRSPTARAAPAFRLRGLRG